MGPSHTAASTFKNWSNRPQTGQGSDRFFVCGIPILSPFPCFMGPFWYVPRRIISHSKNYFPFTIYWACMPMSANVLITFLCRPYLVKFLVYREAILFSTPLSSSISSNLVCLVLPEETYYRACHVNFEYPWIYTIHFSTEVCLSWSTILICLLQFLCSFFLES